MRIVFPYTSPHPLASAALERWAPCAERVQIDAAQRDTNNHPNGYYLLLAALWAAGETFALIEHDNEIHDSVVLQFTACQEQWCLFPYGGPGYRPEDDTDRGLLKCSLGCTRFRQELLQETKSLITDLPVRDWRRLDCEIYPRLLQLGYKPHLHEPVVAHHHVYNGRCACGGSHE